MPGPVLGWAGLGLSSGRGVEAGAQRVLRPKAGATTLAPHCCWDTGRHIHPPRVTRTAGERGSHVDRRKACPASGQVASIPEPWASYQYGTGLATVSDFQWHLPHPHFFMAPIKSYLLCTERQNWRCQEWLRAF